MSDNNQMPQRIKITSGARCINDGGHVWRPRHRNGGDMKPGDDMRFASKTLKRCERCRCTEGAASIWLVPRRIPERGLAMQYCHSFAEAVEAGNDEWYRRNLPGYNAPPLSVTKIGLSLVASPT